MMIGLLHDAQARLFEPPAGGTIGARLVAWCLARARVVISIARRRAGHSPLRRLEVRFHGAVGPSTTAAGARPRSATAPRRRGFAPMRRHPPARSRPATASGGRTSVLTRGREARLEVSVNAN